MDLVTPEIGLIFWTTVTFVILLFLLAKFAWKPILSAVKNREESIREALLSADKAREEMAQLKSDNEQVLREARAERDSILRDAREIREKMIADAKEIAGTEANKMVEQAKELIENQKMAAITDLKNQVASMSIEIAEKIIRKQLENKENQVALVEEQLKDFKLN